MHVELVKPSRIAAVSNAVNLFDLIVAVNTGQGTLNILSETQTVR
jgi:hypothetical protein